MPSLQGPNERSLVQLALHEIYEHALPLALQLLVDAARSCRGASSPEDRPR